MASHEILTQPARNARGVIAEHYYELQSLGLVEQARAERELEPASPASYLRTVLQAAEIAMFNLADLLGRAADGGDHVAKLSWARGFHRVLIELGAAGATFSAATSSPGYAGARLRESPAFTEYLAALRRFDGTLRARVQTGELDLERILSEESLADPGFQLVHLARIGGHEATTWERSLRATCDPAPGVEYGELVASGTLRAAVHEHRLSGDTYFTQFRALHQIPELLAAEINDRLEAAILALREGAVAAALAQLTWANTLARPASACLPPMVDNLATSDYHEIRENLGLTSGSHSVGIRHHLFTDLYEQLCDAVGDDPLVKGQLAAFRTFVFGWRAQHLHLPRNNLGGDATRSLTGSPDAVAVVRGMTEHARARDPARAVLAVPAAEPDEPALAAYVAGPTSLDALVLTATGHVTQRKFTDVQERLGFFANGCPFKKPPRRVVRADLRNGSG